MFLKSLVIALLCNYCDGSKMVVQTIGEDYGTWFPMEIDALTFMVNATTDFYIRFTALPVCNAPGYTVSFHVEQTAMISRIVDVVKQATGEFVFKGDLIPYAVLFNHEHGEIAVSFGISKPPFLVYRDPNYIKPAYFGIYSTDGQEAFWTFHFEGTMDCICYSNEIPVHRPEQPSDLPLDSHDKPLYNPYRYIPKYPNRYPGTTTGDDDSTICDSSEYDQ